MQYEKRPLPPEASRAEVGKRLRLTREALALRKVDICKQLGIQPSAYSQNESGVNMPNLQDMIRYADRFNVTLDWIYRGVKLGLPYEVAAKLFHSDSDPEE